MVYSIFELHQLNSATMTSDKYMRWHQCYKQKLVRHCAPNRPDWRLNREICILQPAIADYPLHWKISGLQNARLVIKYQFIIELATSYIHKSRECDKLEFISSGFGRGLTFFSHQTISSRIRLDVALETGSGNSR